MHAPGNEQDNSAGQEDPHGDPNQWSEEEMRHWLHNVSTVLPYRDPVRWQDHG